MGQSAAEKKLEKRIAELEQKVESITSSRPGRKIKPILVTEAEVCGLDPEMEDSSTCEDASIYRYQMGCRGLACAAKNRNYYQQYRQKNKGDVEQDN